jgi:hypothetical protein
MNNCCSVRSFNSYFILDQQNYLLGQTYQSSHLFNSSNSSVVYATSQMQFPPYNAYQPNHSHRSYQHSYSFMPPTLNPANAAYQTTTAQPNQFSNLEGAHLYSSRLSVSSSNQNLTENPSLHVSKFLFQHEQLILFIVIQVKVII